MGMRAAAIMMTGIGIRSLPPAQGSLQCFRRRPQLLVVSPLQPCADVCLDPRRLSLAVAALGAGHEGQGSGDRARLLLWDG